MASRKSSYLPRSRNAVILIDYTNVFGVISERIDNDQPDAVVLTWSRHSNDTFQTIYILNRSERLLSPTCRLEILVDTVRQEPGYLRA